MAERPDGSEWWVVRMVVDITVAGELSFCEDRFILISASTAEEAKEKGQREALSYGQTYLNGDGETVEWAVRGISDVFGILDPELTDGSEVYSSFIAPDLAATLMTPVPSPLEAWKAQSPGKDPGQATVTEVLGMSGTTNGGRERRRFLPG